MSTRRMTHRTATTTKPPALVEARRVCLQGLAGAVGAGLAEDTGARLNGSKLHRSNDAGRAAPTHPKAS